MTDPLLARLLDEAEARQLPSVIAEWELADDARHWIARALRLDLAHLIEDPALLMPALHRRCARLGDDDAWFTRSGAPRHASEARALVAGWVAAWSPGKRWLRSLWPAALPLDAGVLEEYRTTARGQLGFSADGELVGLCGGDAPIAWERKTGRRVAGTVTRTEYPSWDAQITDGVARLTDGSRVIELRLDVDTYASIDRAVQLSDHALFATGTDGDGYLHWLIDLDRGRLVTQGYALPSGCAAHGETTLIAIRDRIHVYEHGRARASWSCYGVDDLAIAPDGIVATRSGSLIRLWDVSEAIAAIIADRARHRVPPIVAWSPDGELVVSRARLADRTGSILSMLELRDWSGTIEGGPAENYFDFTSEGFVEVTMQLRMWSRRGELVLDDQQRSAVHWNGVAIDPRGRFLAIATHANLTVTELLGGRVVFECAARFEHYEFRLGFSPAGELWWKTADGDVFVLDMQTFAARSADDAVMVRRTVHTLEADDGLLVVGDAALPIDDARVFRAPGANRFAGETTLVELVG